MIRQVEASGSRVELGGVATFYVESSLANL